MGIDAPLLWVETPTAEPVLDSIEHVGIVYQRTDRYEEFDGVDRDAIERHDRALKKGAEVTLYCSSYLYELEGGDCQAAFVDHGVHFDRFEAAGIASVEPPAMVDLRRPRAGFVGGLDDHTFDVDLFLAVARSLPDVEFVLVGGSSLPTDWCTLPNVVHVGQVDYEEVPGYMAACDVLIMPWRQNEWIRACNPVKLKEYLAVGRPVITTWFEELKHYDGLVRIAPDSQAFTSAILSALTDAENPDAGRNRVRSETWAAKAALVETHLHSAGLVPRSSEMRPDRTRAGSHE
jgi:glycosyltransferase involved in cell wall biosynthesis